MKNIKILSDDNRVLTEVTVKDEQIKNGTVEFPVCAETGMATHYSIDGVIKTLNLKMLLAPQLAGLPMIPRLTFSE